MAYFFRFIGRMAGYALKSHILDKAVREATHVVLSEMKLANIRIKLKFLKQKRRRHLNLLGKTVYRLTCAGAGLLGNPHIETITRVLRDIDSEIAQVQIELDTRKQDAKTHKK